MNGELDAALLVQQLRENLRSADGLSAAERVAVEEEVAEELCHNGFTLGQLLAFWRKYAQAVNEEEEREVKSGQRPSRSEKRIFKAREWKCQGTIDFSSTTNEVAKRVIIPESFRRGCYMNVMPGGGHKAETFVSHWWGAGFFENVMCITQHATGLKGVELLEALYDQAAMHRFVELGKVRAEDFAKTYWMCIFAVDEHATICGECFECHNRLGAEWTEKHFVADPCIVCNRRKYNPCSGSPKYLSGHPLSHVDKFHKVMAKIGRLMVALDSNLVTLSRSWCVSEIGTSIQANYVIDFVLSRSISETFYTADIVLPSVTDCAASSLADQDRILHDIRSGVGFEIFDRTVQNVVMPEILKIAITACLETDKNEIAVSLFETLIQQWPHLPLAFDFSINRKLRSLQVLAEQLATHGVLKELDLDCSQCVKLTSIDVLCESIGKLKFLTVLSLKFSDCRQVSNIDALEKTLRGSQALAVLKLDVTSCGISIDNFGSCLSELKALTSLSLNFTDNPVGDVEKLGKGISGLESLTFLDLCFQRCRNLTDAAELARSISSLGALTEFVLNVSGCCSCTEQPTFCLCKCMSDGGSSFIDELGMALCQPRAITSLDLRFAGWFQLPSIDCFGNAIVKQKALTSLNLNFWHCGKLTSVDAIGRSVSRLESLTQLKLNFKYCRDLRNIAELGRALAVLKDDRELKWHARLAERRTEDQLYKPGERVWRKDYGDDWRLGFITTVSPLRVSQTDNVNDYPGVCFPRVRKYNPNTLEICVNLEFTDVYPAIPAVEFTNLEQFVQRFHAFQSYQLREQTRAIEESDDLF